jgi:hypothetical protein
MKQPPPDDRIDRAIEGLLPPGELEQFMADVIRDPELRSAYVDRQWLHASLRAQRETLMEVLVEEPAPAKVVRRWPVALWAGAAAACVTLAASVWTFGRGTIFHRPVATLIQAENCKWAGSELPTALNSKLGTGTLSLVEGIATLKFKSGASVTIEAPTKLLIRDAMHCRLIEGTVTAEVPEPAHGFTVDTPDLKVVDLGTRFGVTAGSTGNSQVRVFQGQVEVGGPKLGELQRLTEGKGMNVSSGNTTAGQEPIHGQQVQEADGWTSIPTSFGRGKDGYARRGDAGGPFGLSPVIIVKHTDIEAGRRNERRAIVTFDISQVPAARVGEAQIVLEPVPSGFGFSSLVPDSRFAIYGITDKSLDSWDEKSMRWESMPGCTDDGPNPNQTQRLAEFWIPRGGTGGPVTVRSDALADFIRRDTDGLASFLIVRETGESDPNGLAHGFASKEHPTARPPTLRLKLSPQ